MKFIDTIRRCFIVVSVLNQVINIVYMILVKEFSYSDYWTKINPYADKSLWFALGIEAAIYVVLGAIDIKYDLKILKPTDSSYDLFRAKMSAMQLFLAWPLYISLHCGLKCFILQVCLAGFSPIVYYNSLVLYKPKS